MDHFVVDVISYVLISGVKVNSGESYVLSLDPVGAFSALELNDPSVLSAIFGFFKIDDGVWVLGVVEESGPPEGRVLNVSEKIAVVFSCVKVVCHIVWTGSVAFD